MMGKKLKIAAGALILLAATMIALKMSGISSFLYAKAASGSFMLPVITIAALIDSINPCAFSILLLSIAFLVSLGRTRGNIIGIGTAYIAGIYIVYLGIGLGITRALSIFGVPHFMAKVGGGLILVAGLVNLANELFPKFPVKLKIPELAHNSIARWMERASVPAAIVLGGLVGFTEFPCTGGPYLLVLGLLHDHATFARGLWYLLYYNVIFVLPLIVMLAVASNRELIDKVQKWRKTESKEARFWTAIGMIALGIFMFAI